MCVVRRVVGLAELAATQRRVSGFFFCDCCDQKCSILFLIGQLCGVLFFLPPASTLQPSYSHIYIAIYS